MKPWSLPPTIEYLLILATVFFGSGLLAARWGYFNYAPLLGIMGFQISRYRNWTPTEQFITLVLCLAIAVALDCYHSHIPQWPLALVLACICVGVAIDSNAVKAKRVSSLSEASPPTT